MLSRSELTIGLANPDPSKVFTFVPGTLPPTSSTDLYVLPPRSPERVRERHPGQTGGRSGLHRTARHVRAALRRVDRAAVEDHPVLVRGGHHRSGDSAESTADDGSPGPLPHAHTAPLEYHPRRHRGLTVSGRPRRSDPGDQLVESCSARGEVAGVLHLRDEVLSSGERTAGAPRRLTAGAG